MAVWNKIITTADDADYKNSNASGGSSYETITHIRRWGQMTSSTWRASSPTSFNQTAQVWSLSTTVSTASGVINYTDNTMSNWVGHQYGFWMSSGDCEVESWTASAHQDYANMDIRMGLWKGRANASFLSNHAGSNQVVDFIGYIDFIANADTNCIHQAQTITAGASNRINSTAKFYQQVICYIFLQP